MQYSASDNYLTKNAVYCSLYDKLVYLGNIGDSHYGIVMSSHNEKKVELKVYRSLNELLVAIYLPDTKIPRYKMLESNTHSEDDTLRKMHNKLKNSVTKEQLNAILVALD